MDNDPHSLIFDYLSGELSPEELSFFEEQLKRDTTLQRATDDRKQLIDASRHCRPDLRKKLEGLQSSSNQRKKLINAKGAWLNYWPIILPLVLLIAFIVYQANSSADANNVISPTLDSTPTDTSTIKALVLNQVDSSVLITGDSLLVENDKKIVIPPPHIKQERPTSTPSFLPIALEFAAPVIRPYRSELTPAVMGQLLDTTKLSSPSLASLSDEELLRELNKRKAENTFEQQMVRGFLLLKSNKVKEAITVFEEVSAKSLLHSYDAEFLKLTALLLVTSSKENTFEQQYEKVSAFGPPYDRWAKEIKYKFKEFSYNSTL